MMKLRKRFKKGVGFALACALLLDVTLQSPVISSADNANNAASGANTFKESQTISLPGGGYDHVYQTDELKITVHEAPANFKPLMATDAQLKEYGFEARPSDSAKLQQWNNKIGHFKKSFVPTDLQVKKDPSAAQKLKGAEFQNTWSGYIVKNNSQSNNFTEVNGTFVQAADQSKVSNADECSWVGLGGYNMIAPNYYYMLSQTGTFMEKINGTAYYYGFVEFIVDRDSTSGSPTIIYNQKIPFYGFVNPGDTIECLINEDTGSSDSRAITYDLGNDTTGEYFSATAVPLDSIDYPEPVQFNSYDGSTAEWIDELPSGGSNYLSDFGSIPWSFCDASSNNMHRPITSYDYNQIIMYTGAQPMAIPSSLDSAGREFTDKWYFN